MRRIRYGVGMSLDSFIANAAGGTDWMAQEPSYDPGPFFQSIDTVLMGRRTFEIAASQGMRSWPGMRSYVFSRTLRPEDYPEVTIVADDAVSTVAALRAEEGKDIWLSGGGVLFRGLAEAGLVDTVEVGIYPILIGQGVPLLPSIPPLAEPLRLELTHHQAYPGGMVVLHYAVSR